MKDLVARRYESGACAPEKNGAMIEAVMFWNEPNNKSRWDLQQRALMTMPGERRPVKLRKFNKPIARGARART